jgi:hepatocyte growth factor-regulated tyrosine kinase substrate
MFSTNPHTAYYSLLALESIVKNCGIPIHEEISNKANCEMFVALVNATQHENVRAKMLELIQTWAYAFRQTEKYRSIRVSHNVVCNTIIGVQLCSELLESSNFGW